MIDTDAAGAIKKLRKRPTLAEKTAKTIVAGFALFGIYTTAFSVYQHQQTQAFKEYGQSVLNEGRALIDTLHKERARALQHDSSALEQILSEVKGLRNDIRTQTVDSVELCGSTHDAQRNGYTITYNHCLATVHFPSGGTLSDASQLLFHDKDRWRSDWAYPANNAVTDPDVVPVGATYTFLLR